MRGRRPKSFVVQRRANLLLRAPEVVERPEKLDVVVPQGADGGERSLGGRAHRSPNGIELESNPLVGPLGKLMDAAFIDRADTASAVAALAPIEEAARKGLSIVIAPEGTRLDTQSVGPFKKGAFRIAMTTGLPIIPIVIRNSESVAGRNSTTLNPGTVDVAVLPPVSTADWTVRDLRERIEEIRSEYVRLLADWPAAGADRAGARGAAS